MVNNPGKYDLLTVLEVMVYLKVCRATVQRWCKEGKLPAVKIGKEYRIRRSDMERWYDKKLDDSAFANPLEKAG